ncbi:MAG: hypothetical protein RPR40_07415, partial [Bermanella sp.]
MTKQVTTGASASWWGAWLEVTYTNIEELDKLFSLSVNVVSGASVSEVHIVDDRGDWDPGSRAIGIGVGQLGSDINLY